MNTVIYARYSAGPRQTDQSIEGQLRVCTDFCKQRGLTVVDTYCDRHISGRTDERPEFQRLIADAKRKKFEAVVVYKTDRFARNKYDSAVYKRELKRNGIQIFYAAEAIPDGPEGIILESLMEGLAEYYSAELAQKIKRGMHESALKCQSTGSGRPLGYRVDEQKHFQIDPESAQTVQTIFEQYIKGESNAAICELLNSRGLRTAQGKPFNKNSINRIIKNRKYIGEYRYHDIVVEGGIPAIISKDTFNLAQAEMERRRTRKAPKSPKAEYLLAGRLFCGHCKGPMQGVSGTGKSGNKWYYYYCGNTRGKNKTCDKKQVSRDRLERAVVDFTVRYILQEEVLEELARKVHAAQERQNDTASEIAFYEKKLADNKKSIANVLRAIESGAATQTLPARLQELENEQAVILGELSFLKGKRLAFTEDQILFALMKHLEPYPGEPEQDYRRRIISDFVSEVYLYDDQLLIYFNISSEDGKLKSADLSNIECGEFDEGLISSTKQVLDEHLFLQRRLRREVFALIHNRKAPSWEETRDGAFSRYSYKAKPVSAERRASVCHADYVGMFSAHDSTGAVAADQLIHLIRHRKVEVKFDRVLQAGGTEAVTETAASVTDAQTAFTFTDSGITVEGSSDGYECNGTVLTIDAAGTYLLSGSCTDGSVKIKKGTTGVRLILSGLSLISADTAPITCNKSSEVVIVAADGTENVLTDAAANNDESNSGNENAENAVIKCKDGSAVTLCGAGTLTLNAYGKNGIKSGATTAEEGEASLTIRELTLSINASVNDAINAEQYLAVESDTLNLATADVALHCDLIMDIGAEGTDGPTIAIAEACEGIEAAALSIRSGDISIVCTDDCLNAANSDLANYDFAINISGGTIVAYTTAGDGFDSNGSLTISGGNVTVWSGGNADNQPLDADGTIAITGGSAGMGMNLSTTQAYVTFGSAGISGMGNMGGQPGSFGGMQPPQNGGQPKSDSKVSGNFQPSDDFRPGDMTSNNISAATATAQAGSGNSSGNAI